MDTEKVENSSLANLRSEAETSDIKSPDESVTEGEAIKIVDAILTSPVEIIVTEKKCEPDVRDAIANDEDKPILKEETVKISDTKLTETATVILAEEEVEKETTDLIGSSVTDSTVNENESEIVTDCKVPDDNVISVTNIQTEETSNINEATVPIESKEIDVESCNEINEDELSVPNAADGDKSEEVDSNLDTSYIEVTVTHEDDSCLITKDKKKKSTKVKTGTETDDDSSYETVSSSSSWCSASETEENETATVTKRTKPTTKALKSSSGKTATTKRVLGGDTIDVKSSKVAATTNKEVKLKKIKSKSNAKVITEVVDEKKKAKVSSSSDKSTKKRTVDDKQSNLLNDSKSLSYKQSPSSSSLKVTIRNTAADVAVNDSERTVEVDDNEQEELVAKPQSAKREETTLLDNSGSSDESVSLENRQSGDGEEIEEEARPLVLPADEDRKNPQYVPKRGYFYEHDNRMNNSAGEDEEEESESSDSEKKEPSKVPKGKKGESDKWSHDLYDPDEQAPKSSAELIQEYGYDIRQEDSAPKTRRRKKYSGKDVKYSRDPSDAEAYQKKTPYRKSQELYTPNKFKGKYNNSRLSISAESKSVNFPEDMGSEKLPADSNNKEGYTGRRQLTESPGRNRYRTSNNYIESANNDYYKTAKRNSYSRNNYDYRHDQEDRQFPALVRKSDEIRPRNYQDSNSRNKNRPPTSLHCAANFDKLKESFNSNYDRSSPKFTAEAAMNHKYRASQRDDNAVASKIFTAIRAETAAANEAAPCTAAKTVFNSTVEAATSVTAKTTAIAVAATPVTSTFVASNHSTADGLITGSTNKKSYYGKGRLQTSTQRHGKSHSGLSNATTGTTTIVSMNFSPTKKITPNKADEYKQQQQQPSFRSDDNYSDVKNVNKDVPSNESPSSDTKIDTVVNNSTRNTNSVNESGFKNFPVSAKNFLEQKKPSKDSSPADSKKALLEDEKNNESKEEQPKFSARYSVRRGFNPNRYGNKPLDMEKFRKHVQARKYNGNSALSDVVGPLHPFLPSSQPNIQQQIQTVPSSVPFYKLQDNRRPTTSMAVVATAQHLDQQGTRPAPIAQPQLQTEAPPMAYYSHQGYSVETPAAVVPRMYGTHDNGPSSAQPPVQYVAYHPPLIPPSNEHSSAPYSPMMAYPPPPPPPPPVPPPHHQATQQLVTYGPEQYIGNTHIQHLNNNQTTSLPLDVYQSPNGVTYYNTTAQIQQQQQSQFAARRANAAIQIIPPEIPPDIDIS